MKSIHPVPLALLLGVIILGSYPLLPTPYSLDHLAGGWVRWRGEVIRESEPFGTQRQCIVYAHSLELPVFQGRIALRLPGRFPDFEPGDYLEGRGWLSIPREAPPGKFNDRAYLRSLGIRALQRGGQTTRIRVLHRPSRLSWERLAGKIRQRIARFFRERMPEPIGAIYAALIVGDRDALPKEIKQIFISAGVYHTLVVSGMNVAWLVAGVWAAGRLLGIGIGLTSLIALALTWAYVSVVGAEPPAVRAGWMVFLMTIARWSQRGVTVFHALVLSALGMLLFAPHLRVSLSFQLSYLATAGVFLGVELARRLPSGEGILFRWTRWSAQALVVSLCAQAAVFPLLCTAFGRFSWIGLGSNLFLIPWVEGAFGMGLLCLAWRFFHWPGLEGVVQLAGWVGIGWVKLTEWFSAWSYGSAATDPWTPFQMFLYYAVLAWITKAIIDR